MLAFQKICMLVNGLTHCRLGDELACFIFRKKLSIDAEAVDHSCVEICVVVYRGISFCM